MGPSIKLVRLQLEMQDFGGSRHNPSWASNHPIQPTELARETMGRGHLVVNT